MNAARILSRIDDTIAELRAIRAEVEREADPEKAPEPAFLSIEGYAERREVSISTVYRWLKHGLPVSRRGAVVRIPVVEADAWDEASARKKSAETAATRGRR